MELKEIVAIIKNTAKIAGMFPGVYRMINESGRVIYVGKAKFLQNRLLFYARINNMPTRLKMMISNIRSIEFTVVSSEIESLILENNLIKELKPFYNILLKDDKTFPYIVLDSKNDFPRIFKFRTTKPKGKDFFGPYPAVSSLEETIKIIQKIFLLRTCTDNYFAQRKRPCLQYFIKRCSAPCADKISKEKYNENVKLAKEFLRGKNDSAREILVKEMNEYSLKMDFENAAVVRDRIKSIFDIQSKQYIDIDNFSSIDFLAIEKGYQKSIIAVSFFRCGRNVGNETFVINNSFETDAEDYILESFITQFYEIISPGSLIVTNIELLNFENLESFLKTKITFAKSGVYKRIIDSCLVNAKIKMKREVENLFEDQLNQLQQFLDIKKLNRIETFDNSHIQGTNSCGAMVVFENGKIEKNKARKFNISDAIASGGDDLAMMKYSLHKRFSSKHITEIPDLIIIDGGKTQVEIAQEVLKNFNLENSISLIGIAKQNNRTIGDEKIIFPNGEEKILGEKNPLLMFLIMLRNEAHRSAISFHRKKRQKSLTKSSLDDINSIGAYRKRKLLEHFGSVEIIKKASIEELKVVKGIGGAAAKLIFEYFANEKR